MKAETPEGIAVVQEVSVMPQNVSYGAAQIVASEPELATLQR